MAWQLLRYVSILMVWAGVDTALLVDIGLRDSLSIFMRVGRNWSMLAQRMSLYRFLILLLDLPLLWW